MSWQPQRKAAAWRVGTKDVSLLITWSVVQSSILLAVILFLFLCSHFYYVLFEKNCLSLVGPLQKEVEGGEQVRGEPHSLKGREGKLPRGGGGGGRARAWRGWWVLEAGKALWIPGFARDCFIGKLKPCRRRAMCQDLVCTERTEYKPFSFFSLLSAHFWLIISVSLLSIVFHLKIFWPLWRGWCRAMI